MLLYSGIQIIYFNNHNLLISLFLYLFIYLYNSITLGGFGVDRFYLGNWQEGFGKLFSFGGLGFWTLIDVILIWVGYLKPLDGNYS